MGGRGEEKQEGMKEKKRKYVSDRSINELNYCDHATAYIKMQITYMQILSVISQ